MDTRDKNISFEEKDHIYTIKGVNGKPTSVTTLIHKYFTPFDADMVIDKMMHSSNWPSSKYFGQTKQQIKNLWKEDGEQSSQLGTIMHKAIENFFNNAIQVNSIEFGYFLNFWNDFRSKYPSFRPYRTEWMIYDDDAKIAGSIDMTLVNDNGEIIICDWKRSKEIKMTNRFQKGLGVLSHLDDCNLNHYSLQLHMYKHILETKYQKKVVGLLIVVLHPNNTNYHCMLAQDLANEVKEIWRGL